MTRAIQRAHQVVHRWASWRSRGAGETTGAQPPTRPRRPLCYKSYPRLASGWLTATRSLPDKPPSMHPLLFFSG